MDKRFILSSLTYAVAGMALGVFMAASNDHSQSDTHAHVLLIGFLLSFVYGLCHKLWISDSSSKLALVQFYLHQVGTFFLSAGLFMHYGKLASQAIIDPILSVSSTMVFISIALMMVLFVKSTKSTSS